jgi:hypothetical protein
MPRTEDPYTFLEWTADNEIAFSTRKQAIKSGLVKKGDVVGYRFLLLCECIIIVAFVIEAVSMLIHAMGN